jgi:hypothetical protein
MRCDTGDGEGVKTPAAAQRDSGVRTLKEGLRRRPTRQLSLPVLFTDHIIVVP